MRTVCFWLALVCAVPATAENHLSDDAEVNRARALIHRGEYRVALTVLRPLQKSSRPDITDIRFLIGIAAISAAEADDVSDADKDALLGEAVAVLHAILIARPGLTRVRLELARAFFLQGNDALSRRHFERVLAGHPPPAIAVNIRRFLHHLRMRQRWSGYVSLGVEQNDNINTGTSTQTIYLFGLPFTVNEDTRPRRETGMTLSAGREYQRPLNARWRWRFGADIARSEYPGHAFDTDTLSLRNGPRFLPSPRSDASLQLVATHRRLARNRYSDEHGLRLDVHHKTNRRLAFNAQLSGGRTRYETAPQLDDTGRAATLGITYLFSPLVQVSARLGNDSEQRKNGEIRRGRTMAFGASTILARGWTLGGNVEWTRRRHNRNAPLSADRRADRKRTARLFILNRGITIAGFSPQLVLTQERQKSNSALDNYRRVRAGVRFVRQW